MAIEGNIESISAFKIGVTTRWLGGDLMTFFPLLRSAKERLAFIKQFVAPNSGRVTYDDFSLKDPLPFFSWMLDGVIRMVHDHSLSPSPHDSLAGIWE
jgi:hypothetical protein